MVEIKFVVEIVIVIFALALLIYWLWTNYQGLSTQFFTWFGSIGKLFGG